MKNAEIRIKNFESRIKKVSLLVIAILMLSTTLSVNAQSVDSLVNEAIQNNPQLKSLQYRIKSAKYKAESTDNLPPPSLGIEFNQIPISKTNIWDNAISQSLSISQMFPLGGKISAMTEVQKKNVLIEGNNYDVYKTNLTANLKMSYYTLWLSDRKIEVQEENLRLFRDLLKSMQTLYEINKITQADLLMLQSEISNGESQLIILRNNRDSEVYNLNRMLGRNLDSKDIYAVKIFENNKKIPSRELETFLVDQNPSLKRMRSIIEMNKSETIANEKEMIPDLMVQGMIMRMPQGMILTGKSFSQMMPGDSPKTEWMYGLMASITLPFAPWSANKISARTDELTTQTLALESEKEEMTREMVAKLKQVIVKLKNARELSELYPGKVIPLYRKTVDAQVSAYQNNLTNINSVLESARMLLMQEMNHFMAQADYQMALAEIEMMIGKQL